MESYTEPPRERSYRFLILLIAILAGAAAVRRFAPQRLHRALATLRAPAILPALSGAAPPAFAPASGLLPPERNDWRETVPELRPLQAHPWSFLSSSRSAAPEGPRAWQPPAPQGVPRTLGENEHLLFRAFAIDDETPAPGVKVVDNSNQYYPVTGATAHELQADIFAQSTRRGDLGLCTTQVLPHWHISGTDACRLDDLRVELSVTITLPNWDGEGELRARFDRYVVPVLAHERSHRAVAIQGANDLLAALAALEGPCGELARQAQRVVSENSRMTDARQEDYHRAVKERGVDVAF